MAAESKPSRILIVDDDAAIRMAVSRYFRASGMAVESAESCAQANVLCERHAFDVVILDFQLLDGTALDCIPKIKARCPETRIVILTGNPSIERAVDAIKLGAENFLIKPIDMAALALVVKRSVDSIRASAKAAEAATLAAQRRDPFGVRCDSMRLLEQDVQQVLKQSSPVLISGETGTGKTTLARWIHANSVRASGPFVELNCAGLSRELLESELLGYERGAFTGAVGNKVGLFELAHGGTLFLDEIGDMDSAVQAKLLKVVEEQKFRRLGAVRELSVDVRILAATHHNIDRLLSEGSLRQDLYYRLSALRLHVPALRDRLEVLPAIVERTLAAVAAKHGYDGTLSLDASSMAQLAAHSWPGNFRELFQVLERASFSVEGGGMIRPEHLRISTPPKVAAQAPVQAHAGTAGMTLAAASAHFIERAIEAHGGNLEATARQLGISRSTLYQKIERFRLAVPGRTHGKNFPHP